jgi:hypothetical protein
MNIVNGQIMELNEALTTCQDLNNKLVEFRQQKENPLVYEGQGTDNRTYYISINQPTMCTISIVKNK